MASVVERFEREARCLGRALLDTVANGFNQGFYLAQGFAIIEVLAGKRQPCSIRHQNRAPLLVYATFVNQTNKADELRLPWEHGR